MLRPQEPKQESRESQLSGAQKFYEETIVAVKGGKDLLEFGYFPGKLARKIGPAMRALSFIEASTKEELRKIKDELTELRKVVVAAKPEVSETEAEISPNVE